MGIPTNVLFCRYFAEIAISVKWILPLHSKTKYFLKIVSNLLFNFYIIYKVVVA